MRNICFLLITILASAVWANEDMKARDSLSEKARARLYDGGADEQPLMVQQSLSEPRADGSESLMQRKLLNNGEAAPDGEQPTDETSSGF